MQFKKRRFEHLLVRVHRRDGQKVDPLEHFQQQNVWPAFRLQGFIGKQLLSKSVVDLLHNFTPLLSTGSQLELGRTRYLQHHYDI